MDEHMRSLPATACRGERWSWQQIGSVQEIAQCFPEASLPELARIVGRQPGCPSRCPGYHWRNRDKDATDTES